MHFLKTTLFISFIFLSLKSYAAIDCQRYYDDLDNVRSIMRSGYKEPYGERLRERERKIKEQIRLCKNGSENEFNYYSSSIQQPIKRLAKQNIHVTNKDQLGRQTLTLKGIFEGEKQQAWLDHYQKPVECSKPKLSSVFAKCLNLRDKASIEFSEQWNKKNKSSAQKQNPTIRKVARPLSKQKHNPNTQKMIAQKRALNLNRATCNFWKEKLKQDPKDLDVQTLMENECKKVN